MPVLGVSSSSYFRDRHTLSAMMAAGINTNHTALSIFTGWECPLDPVHATLTAKQTVKRVSK